MFATLGLTYVATAAFSYLIAALGAKRVPLPEWIWARRSEAEDQPCESRRAA